MNKKILYDVLLTAAVLAAAALLYMGLRHFGSDGQTVLVTKDGEVIAEKPININDTIEIVQEGAHNRVVIDNGTVFMENADCPDKICVKTGRISMAGETIVCLPHKVVVEIKGRKTVDSVAQ